jgi:hypothetical protein
MGEWPAFSRPGLFGGLIWLIGRVTLYLLGGD